MTANKRTENQKCQIAEIKSYMKAPNRLISESLDEKSGTIFLDYSNPSRDCLFRIAIDRKGEQTTSYLK
jgi:hypothetical protein